MKKVFPYEGNYLLAIHIPPLIYLCELLRPLQLFSKRKARKEIHAEVRRDARVLYLLFTFPST
jgi:hypothetical protein